MSKCEIFHLNMLQYFNVLDKVETIHIRCAAKDVMSGAMKDAIGILSKGRASVDFKIVPQKKSWEHDTIKEAVEYSISTGTFVYYTHFKGVSRMGDAEIGTPIARRKYGTLDVMYWCYILYASLFDTALSRGFNGVILRNGINATYDIHGYDCSWSIHGKCPGHHYAGSFQSFDGSLLSERFLRLGLSKDDRARKLWVHDPYTVEMFLSLVSDLTETSFTHLGLGIGSYNLYQGRRYPDTLYSFQHLYVDTSVRHKIHGKYVVLTYLYGNHTLLRDLLFVDAGVEYVCISDRPLKDSKVWKNIVNPLAYLSDDRLRVAYVKFHPFEFVDAEKVLVLDASYHITGSVLPLFEQATNDVMLLPHLYRSRLKEELSVWVELGRMTSQQASWFKTIVPYLGGNLDEPLYELSASVWSDTPMAHLLGMETYAVLEFNGFPSNQMPCSLLAERHFKGFVGSIQPGAMKGLRKYLHNTWTLCNRQSYNA
ncbi:MAG: hypothetical protein J5621_03325 [Paludibacteraceae bacterium]|nr:hypothetical protein [Paludibacteraceae bacterium]